jgi:hypothetical protein
MATSADGIAWNRHGTMLEACGAEAEEGGVSSPCVLRLHDGSLRLWYAALAGNDAALAYRICSASSAGPWSI